MAKRRWITIAAVLAAAKAITFVLWLRLGPLPPGLLDAPQSHSTVVVDRNGEVLYEARSGQGTRTAPLAAETLPQHLVSATIAAEDHRFYRHHGLDLVAIGRAAFHNLRARKAAEGGSTITQQVAKLLLARRRSVDGRRPDRTTRNLTTKLYEAVIALRLEQRFSKREILALYLNLAPFGNQIVGAEQASRIYFGSPATLLTPAQAAFLAALPQRPSAFNPYRDRRLAIARQRRVIARMIDIGVLSRQDAAEALAERLVFAPDRPPFVAPHFVDMVLSGVGDERPARVETTLDAELQRNVEGIVRSQRASLERHGAHNVAIVVLRNDTGEWLAWEGSGDYFDADHGGAINGPLALRQPGSALKPFTYALAFEDGKSPATVLPDVPSNFPTAEEGIVYSPRNYDGRYRGPLLARRALAGSENVPAVALTAEIGAANLVRFLRAAGFTTFEKTAAYYGLGITLGNAEVRLTELTAAYGAFARGGLRIEPTGVRAVGNGRGEAIEPPGAIARVMSARSAFWITDILSDSNAREYIFGRGGSLEFPFPVAVKTGTSEGYRDNWTIGYTREVTVGVWVGNFDRSALTNSSGVTGAGPIFHAVMLAAQRRVAGHLFETDDDLADVPAGVSRQPVCALSGMRANAWCPSTVNEWLPVEHSTLPCSWHHQSDDGVLVVWPPTYRQWARGQGLMQDESAGVRPGPAVSDDRRHQHMAASTSESWARLAVPVSNGQRFAIANPPAGAVYLIDPTLRPEYQTLMLRTVADRAAGRVVWAVDGRVIGTSDADEPIRWSLTAGAHRLIARDSRGNTAESTILVK